MDSSKSLGRYLVDEVGGRLLDEREEFSRYGAVLENLLEGECNRIEDVVRKFYFQQGFKPLSSDKMMCNFFKKGLVKSVVWTYDSLNELLKVRCDSLG